jgi:N-glycosylase/DNA lyase
MLFSLDATLCCGQTFRWEKRSEWWYGIVRDTVFKIRQKKNELEFENTSPSFVNSYFGLNDDLQKIYREICKDNYIKQAIKMSKGLRILHQDPWECLVSYICATYKNIAAIRQMLHELSHRFGEKIRFEGVDFYAFPTSEKLGKTSVTELTQCGLGYRAEYLYSTARTIYIDNFDLKLLRKESYEKAKLELLEFPGVGAKVADCVLLFSLGKLEAFPVDVWIKRVILKYYSEHFPKEFVMRAFCRKSLSKAEYERLNCFGREYFGEYAGYAQEYLYHYERTKQ